MKCFGNDEKLACNPGIVSESTATSLHPCTEDVELETNLHAPSVDALVSKDSKGRSKFNDFVGEIMFQYFEKEDGGTLSRNSLRLSMTKRIFIRDARRNLGIIRTI